MQEDIICFTVPYLIPPSGNHYKRPCRYTGRDGFSHMGFKLTKDAKAYYAAVAIFARGRTVSPQTDNERRKVQYSVTIDVYLGERQRGDADNFTKCALDAIQNCGMIHSDAYVRDCKVTVHKDERENPRTEYLVSRLEEMRG